MPTIILLDTSADMGVCDPDSEEKTSKLLLATEGLDTLLGNIALYSRLEFIALITFSSHYDLTSSFTRDYDFLKTRMSQLKTHSIANLEPALFGVEKVVVSEWGTGTLCNVIIVTQENLIVPPGFKVPFTFPGNLIFVNLSSKKNVTFDLGIEHFKQKLYQPDSPLCSASCQSLFLSIGNDFFASWIGTLMCGNFNSKVTLSPPPLPYTKTTDFDCCTYSMENVLEICGFLELQHLGSPAAVSRHLVLPCSTGGTNLVPRAISTESPHFDSDDETTEEGQIPSFCVLLHGALKVENMAALCCVGNDWYGVLFSWADSKKKSNLMLSLLEPGPDSVPWLGNLNNLMIPSSPQQDSFPVKPIEKRSYSQNCISWIRQPGLQSDIQKILRHARKIPDKTQQFYKELNRVRRAAISLGFIALIEGIADILERECTLLPGTAHPACAFQLSHAAGVLREPYSKDPKYNIMPMKMSFT